MVEVLGAREVVEVEGYSEEAITRARAAFSQEFGVSVDEHIGRGRVIRVTFGKNPPGA